ncbi:MAG: ferritin family protein [Halieaceae bacterium]
MTQTNTELANFLAHSIELESEARDRYEELADSMAEHHNEKVAEFFQRMCHEASQHLAEVAVLAEGMTLPELKAWEFSWPGAEPPETASYEAMHYRMSLREAMLLALANELAAENYYRQFADNSSDQETAQLAAQFADEELSHGAELERLLQAVPENAAHLREEDDDPHMPE